jgi:TolB protein
MRTYPLAFTPMEHLLRRMIAVSVAVHVAAFALCALWAGLRSPPARFLSVAVVDLVGGEALAPPPPAKTVKKKEEPAAPPPLPAKEEKKSKAEEAPDEGDLAQSIRKMREKKDSTEQLRKAVVAIRREKAARKAIRQIGERVGRRIDLPAVAAKPKRSSPSPPTGFAGAPGTARVPPEYLAYFRRLDEKIRSNWTVPTLGMEEKEKLMVQLRIVIEKSGLVSRVRMEKTSGNSFFDDSVRRAINKASPLPIPPEQLRGGEDHYEVGFRFYGALLFPSVTGAVLYIDINAPGGKRMPVALPDFVVTGGDASLARDLPGTIAGDLAMTSLFDVIPRPAYLERIVTEHFSGRRLSFPDWKMIGAEAVVIGKVEVQGDQMKLEMHLYDATLGNMMAGRKYTGPVRRFRKMAHKFANEVLYAFTGVRGVFDTEIAFTARPGKGKGKEIYVIGLDGKDLRQLTDNRSFNLFPRWSPDGEWLAYTSYRTGTPQIYMRNLFSGTDRLVVRYGNSKSPGSFSPSGDSLYATLSVGGNSDIYRVSLSGSSVRKVAGGWGIEVSPSVSPDGKSIAFVSDRSGSPQVYVKELDSSDERRVSRAGYYSTSPSWSPAGDRIAFTSLSEGRYAIYTVRPDGSDHHLAISDNGSCIDPSFSPDGRYLVYTLRKSGYSELKIASVDGRWKRRLFKGLRVVGSPSWSPRQ